MAQHAREEESLICCVGKVCEGIYKAGRIGKFAFRIYVSIALHCILKFIIKFEPPPFLILL